jgi:hypothetical protein
MTKDTYTTSMYDPRRIDSNISNISQISSQDIKLSTTTTTKDLESILSDNGQSLEVLGYQLCQKSIERICLDIISNGFTFEQVNDDLNYDNNNKEDSQDKDVKFKSRLSDLKGVLYNPPIQKIDYIDLFVSITEIVTNHFIFNKNIHEQYIYTHSTEKPRLYYAFVFTDCIKEASRTVIKPKGRKLLLGIQMVIKSEKDKKIVYLGEIKGQEYQFNEDLIISSEYGKYNALFNALFGLYASLLNNTSKSMNVAHFLQVIAPDNYFALDGNSERKKEVKQAFQDLVDGKSGGIATTNQYQMVLQNITNSGQLTKTGAELLYNSTSFVTGIPKAILYGISTSGINNSAEEERIKYEFAIKSIAENFFIPIMHDFCKLCNLSDWQNLEYKTTAGIRETIDIFNTIVPEELKTEERLFYIGMKVDALLGIDSKTKAELKKQFDKDNEQDSEKQGNNNNKSPDKTDKKRARKIVNKSQK